MPSAEIVAAKIGRPGWWRCRRGGGRFFWPFKCRNCQLGTPARHVTGRAAEGILEGVAGRDSLPSFLSLLLLTSLQSCLSFLTNTRRQRHRVVTKVRRLARSNRFASCNLQQILLSYSLQPSRAELLTGASLIARLVARPKR
jgi:hypothetical protein